MLTAIVVGMIGVFTLHHVGKVKLSGWSRRTIETWGDLGKVLPPDLLRLPRTAFAIGVAVALFTLLLVLKRFTLRQARTYEPRRTITLLQINDTHG